MNTPCFWFTVVVMATISTLGAPEIVKTEQQTEQYLDELEDPPYSLDTDEVTTSIRTSPCPDPCTCSLRSFPDWGLQGLLATVNCSGRGILGFPPFLDNQTQGLDMSRNKLINMTSIPLLPELLVLDMSNNWMRVLDNHWVFEHVTRLQVLRLADNALSSLQHGSFSGLSELRILDLSKNIIRRIETHAFSGLSSLQVLRLDKNDLYQLKREWFLPLTSLTSLHLADNHVARLEPHSFNRLAQLHHLDLSRNSLRQIPDEALVGLTNLRLLNLSGNAYLRSAPSRALQACPGLGILLLDGAGLSRLQPFGLCDFWVSELSLSYMPNLRVVEKSAFHNLTGLGSLQLHDNPRLVFLHPSAFSRLPSLRHLLIHNNGLLAVSSQIIVTLPSLTDLHLHHNPLRCDCNIFWLRKELSRVYPLDYKNKLLVESEDTLSSWSNFSSPDGNQTESPSPRPASPHSLASTFISEPDRVTCFFPAARSSMPLVQLPIQYFSPTCPPSALALFSDRINVSLGDELWLECHGIGVPAPSMSWILPGNLELNYSSAALYLLDNVSSPGLTVEIVEDSLLFIKSVRQSDSGIYGCRASSHLGDDVSRTAVYVQNKPLTLTDAKISNDAITLSWRGSIPKIQMSDFQIFYRKVGDSTQDSLNTSRSSTASSEPTVVFLHGAIHTCTISGLRPLTTYEVCLMYRQLHPVQCHNYTTTSRHLAALSASDGIMRVNRLHLGLGLASVAGLLLLALLVWLVRRVHGHRELKEDKGHIPMEGIYHTTPSTPLTTSRTALLINSQI